jgi:hypothetical protein
MTRYGRLTSGLIAAWFLFALFASALHLFLNESGRVGIAVGLAALIPILLFALWFAGSASFRQFALSLNPSTLTLAQSWRIFGFTFVLLQAHNILPALFALPAGYGDMFIGMTASYVALRLASPKHRGGFIGWQVLGMADLVMAVGLGTTARLFSPHGASMAAMTVLPLSLVPTFIVPLLFIFHIICIAQARAWKGTAARDSGVVDSAVFENPGTARSY